MAKAYAVTLDDLQRLSGHIDERCSRIEGALALILREIRKGSHMAVDLATEVANNTSVVDSALALIQGLAGKLTAAQSDPVAIQVLIDQLNANDAKLAAAVAANTPAAPPQPVTAAA